MEYRALHNAIRTAPRPEPERDDWTWEEESAIGMVLQSREMEYLVLFWVAVTAGAFFGAILMALVAGTFR